MEIDQFLIFRRFSLRTVFQRHGYRDFRAHSLFGLHVDAAIHHLDQIFGNGQAKPGTDGPVITAILLGKGVKDRFKLFLIDPDAGILDAEKQCRQIIVYRCARHRHDNRPRCFGKLDRIAQNLAEHLFKFCLIANVIIIYRAQGMTFITEPLLTALGLDGCINLLQHGREVEFFPAQGHLPGFNPAHIHYPVD